MKLFVKRRAGHLSHVHDPPNVNKAHSLEHCVIAESVPGCCVGDKVPMCAEIIAPYTDDASMWIFARLICADLISPSLSSSHLRPLGGVPGGCTRNWNAQALFECISADKQHVLTLYLQLHQYAQQLKTCVGNIEMQHAWSLRLVLDYYDRDSHLIKHLRCRTVSTAQLIRPSFIESIRFHLASLFGDSKEAEIRAGWSSSPCSSKKSLDLGNGSHKNCRAILACVLLPAFLRK